MNDENYKKTKKFTETQAERFQICLEVATEKFLNDYGYDEVFNIAVELFRVDPEIDKNITLEAIYDELKKQNAL